MSGLECMDKWDNNKYIKKYLNDRIKSKYKIVLFLEYIPYVAGKYLEDNPNFIENFYEQSNKIIKFCNKNGILHNDAHLYNFIINDKNKVYLTDFGISLDIEFKLKKDEIDFFNSNKKYDEYLLKIRIILYINTIFCNNNKIIKKYELDINNQKKTDEFIFNNIDVIKDDIIISKFEIDLIKKYNYIYLKFNEWIYNFTEKNEMKYFSVKK